MKKVLSCFSKKSSNGNNAALPISANTPPYKNQVASRLLLAMLFMLATVQGLWGESVTFDFTTVEGCTAMGITRPSTSSTGYELIENSPYTISPVSMTITNSSAANKTKIWNAGGNTDFRTYHSGSGTINSSTLTISGGSNTITQIVFAKSSNGTLNFSTPTGTLGELDNNTKTYTWTGSATSVTFSTTATSYIKSFTVTYGTVSPRTVTFMDDSSTETEESAGSGITLPTRTACTGYKFTGWSTTNVGSSWSSSAVDTITTAETYYPSSDVNLYPVYLTTEGEGMRFDRYERVVSTPDDWSGKYLLSSATGGKTATGVYNTTENGLELTTNNLLDGKEHSSSEFTLTKVGEKYTIQLPNGDYIGNDGSAVNLSKSASHANDDYVWIPSTSDIKDSTNYRLLAANSNLTPTIKTYGTSTSNTKILLYKRIEVSNVTTYYRSLSPCAGCEEGEVPSLEDITLTGIKADTISVSCPEMSSDADCSIRDYGFIWEEDEEPIISDHKTRVGTVDHSEAFSAKLPISFTTGTTYYIKAYATNGKGDGFSDALAVTPQSVTFNTNGGSEIATAYVNNGGKVSEPATDPTKDGYVFAGWYQENTFDNEVDWNATITADKIYYSRWVSFSVSGPSRDTVFITSAASKKVRSQEAFHVSASGLETSTTLSFTIDNTSVSGKFEFKAVDGTAISTDEYGDVNADFYVYYTPGSGDVTDGLDVVNSLTLSDGTYDATIDTKLIIGRHLPSQYVIAAKKDNKWWALPSDMENTSIPSPVEIVVDNDNNPSIAFTASSNIYGLYGPTAANISGGNGQYVRLTMSITDGTQDPGPAPLFGSTTTSIGKSNNSQATSNLTAGYWWKLVQTSASVTNPQDAKYKIYCANNDKSLTLEDAGKWGLYATNNTDVDELRLIPVKSGVIVEADVVEWGQHSAVIEVDAVDIGADKVIAHLGATSSDAITLNQTLTSGKGSATIYNYTVNFGNDIDFAEKNGSLLYLEWKDGSTTVGGSNIRLPRIIATNKMMSSDNVKSHWTTSVHILPGVTLNANAFMFSSGDVTIDELNIYPGATVNVTSGTLIATTLIMRNGWTRAGEKAYDVARIGIKSDANLQHSHAYADWYIDYDQYYPVAVPFPVVTADSISYVNIGSAASAGVKIRYYDGEKRATNVQANQDANWVEYNWNGTSPAMPTNLVPGVGYAMTARRPAGKAFSIVRMKMSFTDDWTTDGEQAVVSATAKNTVTLGDWGYGTSVPSYAQGWNFIANPYMALFNAPESDEDASYILGKLACQDGGSIRYATIPTVDFKDYDQYPIIGHGLKPFSAFFVQAATAGAASFVIAGKSVPSMPALNRAPAQTDKDIEAYIELRGDEGRDMMGLIIGEQYTAGYDINGDLTKMMGSNTNSVKTYMRYGDEDMAYVAINSQLSSGIIPVIVRIPANGEYTFSLSELSEIEDLEGIYLTDYQTDEVTNLLYDTYHFYADKGTLGERFALNAVVGEHKTPTGIDALSDGEDTGQPHKFIYHGRMYILHNNVLYDASGKRINTIND